MRIIYVHGFNSSPASFKAGLLRKKLGSLGKEADFSAPHLPHRPLEAIATLETEVRQAGSAALVGSSLGGFYATWLAEKYALKAVLVNPSVRPYESLREYVGPQKNLYTGVEYEFTARHLAELRELEMATITPDCYLLLVQTGDEVLDYREAVDKYRGARQIVVDGGDHAFSGFGDYLDLILRFCGVAF